MSTYRIKERQKKELKNIAIEAAKQGQLVSISEIISKFIDLGIEKEQKKSEKQAKNGKNYE